MSYLQLLPEKTPLSGPSTLKTRAGRKRRRDDTELTGNKEMESLENEYRSEWKRFGNAHLENVIVIIDCASIVVGQG